MPPKYPATTTTTSAMKSSQTHCCYCAMQCQMFLSETDKGVVVKGLEHPINHGKLCVLGQNSAKLFDHAERLMKPLVRKQGQLVEASWEEALERAVAGFKFLRRKHGNDVNAVYSGASVSNEKAYLLGKFARVALKTRHVDYNGRYCMSAAASGAIKAFGLDRGLNMPLSDIPKHDVIMIVGSNPAETLPIIMQYLLAAKKQGTQFIVVDPRRTTTANLAALHLPLKLGGDLALANTILHEIIANEKEANDFISRRTNQFEGLTSYIQAADIDLLIEATGLEFTQIQQASQLLYEAKKPLILTGRGNDQNTRGVESTLAFINVALALGANYGTLTGQANGQGAREHGLKADQLAGYRSIHDPEARQHISRIWNITEDGLPSEGYTAFEILEAIGRKDIRGMFVLGSNPIVSSPDKDKVKAWLSEMEHLVVVDTFVSETASVADVVLPGSLWAEETGTTTNLEGRVVLREALRHPPADARTDLNIILEIAKRLDAEASFSYEPENVPEQIFNELRHATKGAPADYFGITYSRLKQGEELFWPCPDENSTGVKRIFESSFAHPDGRAKFHVTPFRPNAEVVDEAFPLQLTTGRYLVHYLTGNQTRRTELLTKKRPEPFVEIHPDTAEKLELTQDAYATLKTRRAEAQFKVKLSPKIRPDTVFIPIHWNGEQAANRLTNPALDPHCKMPEFKAAAVRLEPVINSNSSISEGVLAHKP